VLLDATQLLRSQNVKTIVAPVVGIELEQKQDEKTTQYKHD